MLKLLTETLANLSAIITIISYIATEKRLRDDRKRKREEAYRKQLEEAVNEKGAYPRRMDKHPRR